MKDLIKKCIKSIKQKSIAMAGKLVNCFKNKYCDLKRDAALVNDFIKKYNKSAVLHNKQKVDKTLMEFSIEDIEIEAKSNKNKQNE